MKLTEGLVLYYFNRMKINKVDVDTSPVSPSSKLMQKLQDEHEPMLDVP